MMNKKSNILLSIALIITLISITSISFAYWDNLSKAKNYQVTMGEGARVLTEAVATAPEGKRLVPRGCSVGIDEVDKVTLEYNVRLSKKILGPGLKLLVSASNITVGDFEHPELVDIIFTYPDEINNENVKVFVEVALKNDETQDYSEIYNKEIKFTLEFEALKNN